MEGRRESYIVQYYNLLMFLTVIKSISQIHENIQIATQFFPQGLQQFTVSQLHYPILEVLCGAALKRSVTTVGKVTTWIKHNS